MDRAAFYTNIRGSLFGGSLTAEQVGGMEAMLNAGVAYPVRDLRHMAYIFATVYHETGRKMVPVREGFAKTDAGAVTAVTKLFNAGKISTNYALPDGGVSYFGRGRVQNTWKTNYEKLEERFGLPFVSQPDILLDSEVDATVTIAGHVEGIWTGKKLVDFINDRGSDYVTARKIVNGTDKAQVIAAYAVKFEKALRAAAWTGMEATVTPVVTAPVPVAPMPTPISIPLPVIVDTVQEVVEAIKPEPSETQSKSPVSKVIGSGKGAVAGGAVNVAIAGVIISILQSYNITIPGVDGTTLGLIVGTVLSSVTSGIAGMIGTYRAKRNAD